VCASPSCGEISLAASDTEPEPDLKTLLVGDAPAVRYLPPWLRLFLRSLSGGYAWKPAMTECVACASGLSFELLLNPRVSSAAPFRTCICVSCGWTTTMLWLNGERAVLEMEGAAWDEPPAVLSAFRRALEEHSPDGWRWDFLT
jgi:hypothetical protein